MTTNNIQSTQESFRLPTNNLASQMQALQESFRLPANNLASQMQALQESFRLPANNLASQMQALQESFQNFNYGNIINFVNTVNYQELSEVIETYSEINDNSITESITSERTYSHEELLELIDSRIAEHQTNLNSNNYTIKNFVYDIAVSLGVDAAKYFINVVFKIIFAAVLLINSYSDLGAHLTTISKIQISINTESEVKGYIEAKKIIKADPTIANYERLNEIGIIRIDTYVRKSNTKSASLALPKKINIDTIVSVLERKNNWVLIQLSIDDKYVEGWIEESKVIKFKKQD